MGASKKIVLINNQIFQEKAFIFSPHNYFGANFILLLFVAYVNSEFSAQLELNSVRMLKI